MPIATINPATGETVRTFDALSESDVAARLDRAARAFQLWRVTPVAQRAANLRLPCAITAPVH